LLSDDFCFAPPSIATPDVIPSLSRRIANRLKETVPFVPSSYIRPPPNRFFVPGGTPEDDLARISALLFASSLFHTLARGNPWQSSFSSSSRNTERIAVRWHYFRKSRISEFNFYLGRYASLPDNARCAVDLVRLFFGSINNYI